MKSTFTKPSKLLRASNKREANPPITQHNSSFAKNFATAKKFLLIACIAFSSLALTSFKHKETVSTPEKTSFFSQFFTNLQEEFLLFIADFRDNENTVISALKENPTEKFSIISGTGTCTAAATEITGKVWKDTNFDGIQNESPVEGVQNVTVSIYDNDGTISHSSID